MYITHQKKKNSCVKNCKEYYKRHNVIQMIIVIKLYVHC